MYFTGFADEAGAEIDVQIRVTRELGWSNIECRQAGSENLHDISDADFDIVYGKLADAGVSVNSFGSTIANWGCQVTDPFEDTLTRVDRAIPRMQRLRSKLVRMMSYAVRKLEDGGDAPDQMEEERFRRLREIVTRFTDAGITPVHENCMNYGGMSYQHTLKMLENVPGLKLVFDTGNPIFTADRSKPEPQPRQNTWEFYTNVREHIAYLHIKDGEFDGENMNHCWAGDGSGCVRQVVTDLLRNGYDGGISMEPHMGTVFHDPSVTSEATKRQSTYIEYGRRFMTLMDEIRASL
ncbi:MAG TPA: xylose isomerase [Lentisphaeria bacterium]|nr:xylose isomerase [Lentisphaeria bacterium]